MLNDNVRYYEKAVHVFTSNDDGGIFLPRQVLHVTLFRVANDLLSVVAV